MRTAISMIVIGATMALATGVYADGLVIQGLYKAKIVAKEVEVASSGNSLTLDALDISCAESNKSFVVLDESDSPADFIRVVIPKGTNASSVVCLGELHVLSIGNPVTAIRTNKGGTTEIIETASTWSVSNAVMQGSIVMDVKALFTGIGTAHAKTNLTARGVGILVDTNGHPGTISVTVGGAVQ